ncbi:MAG: protein translocase subunit SecF [Ruminococcus sp.]|jgi:preprotein translocase SecF subunit|nr:protein translocase subunit SecF [Ruminococcus sp.]
MASNIKKKTLEEKLQVNGKKPKDFIGSRKIYFGISLAIILIGIVCNFIFGTTLDIQFTGGSMLKYSYTGSLKDSELKSLVQEKTPDDVVTFSDSKDLVNNKNVLTVQFSGTTTISTKLQKTITDSIQKAFPDNNFTLEQSSSVDATMGASFLWKCIVAVAIAGALMVLYVTLRFKKIGGLSAGVMGLVALFHDIAIIYFFYVIFRMPIDSSFMAVALMILGYSLNDTVVVYDRVREERKNLGYKADIADVFNLAATKVMRRTIITSITTITAVVIVFIVAVIYNLDSVKAFALPMIVGLVSGCYSSLCIAGPLWVMWKKRPNQKKK